MCIRDSAFDARSTRSHFLLGGGPCTPPGSRRSARASTLAPPGRAHLASAGAPAPRLAHVVPLALRRSLHPVAHILLRRGPLHPAWLTSFRSRFDARSTRPRTSCFGGGPCTPPGSRRSARASTLAPPGRAHFASAGAPAPRLAHVVPLALRRSLHPAAHILLRRGPLHPAWLTSFRSRFDARSTRSRTFCFGGGPCTPPGSRRSARASTLAP